MASDITTKVGIEGEAEFKKQIKEINTSLKTMGAEMEAVTSAYIGNEHSVEALTAKQELLTSKFEEQSKKVDLLKERLKQMDDQGVDPTSSAYQSMVQQLYKAEAAMNKTEAEIKEVTERLDNNGKTAKEVGEEQAKAADEAAKAQEKAAKEAAQAEKEAAKEAEEAHKRHKQAVEDVTKAISLTVTAVAAMGAALLGMTLKAAAAADELSELSTETGISTDDLQKFKYAAEAIDVDVGTLAGSMSKLTKSMASAATGSGSSAEAFEKLGIAVQNDDGTFRDRNEVFQEAIKALGEMTDEVDRDATAMAIFGKSAQELNPLIKGGAKALDELGKHAEEAGLILSEDGIATLASLNDSFGIFKQTASLAGQQFLVGFAEPIKEAIDTVTGYIEQLVGAFHEGGFAALGETVGEIASDITSKLVEFLPQVAQFATQLITTLASSIISQLPTILSSAIEVITTLVNGLVAALPELIPVAIDAVLTLVDTLTDPDTLGSLIDAAISITMALANGLIDALPQLIEKAPEIIANLVQAIVENVPKLVTAAFEIISSLVTGIIENLPEIGRAALDIINTLLGGLASLWDSMVNIGKNIVEGIWEGIKNMSSWLWDQVSGFFSGIVGGIKDFLGIHSPSTVFAGIGENMAAGIGVGFDKEMDKVERDMMSTFRLPTANVNVGTVSAPESVGSVGMVEEITIPVEVGGVELARVLYRHIVGEGQRIGAAAVS